MVEFSTLHQKRNKNTMRTNVKMYMQSILNET